MSKVLFPLSVKGLAVYAAHIITNGDGLSYVGVGPADEARLRSVVIPDPNMAIWLGPARERRYNALADYFGIRLAIWKECGVVPLDGGWMRLHHHRAVAVASIALPLGERPETNTPAILALALGTFCMTQEALGHLIGASAPKVSRMLAGNGELSHQEFERLRWWANATGMGDVFASALEAMAEPEAPRPAMLNIVGGTEQ